MIKGQFTELCQLRGASVSADMEKNKWMNKYGTRRGHRHLPQPTSDGVQISLMRSVWVCPQN